jgi:aspartate carbamoyltransferase regulatory subunit
MQIPLLFVKKPEQKETRLKCNNRKCIQRREQTGKGKERVVHEVI